MSEEPKKEDEQVARTSHYLNLIEGNVRMGKSHVRLFNYWCPRIGAPMAYEMARVAFHDNGRYQLLRGRYATQ